jgi:hypothetical protein
LAKQKKIKKMKKLKSKIQDLVDEIEVEAAKKRKVNTKSKAENCK